MRLRVALLTTAVAAIAAIVWIQEREGQASPAAPAQPEGTKAAPKTLGEAYLKAFNARDAKAIAALWTAEGEYTGPDGEIIRGRAEIEKDLTEQFKNSPKVTLEIKSESFRTIGTGLAISEGVCRATAVGSATPVETRYTTLFAKEDGEWKIASVQEWFPDPVSEATIKDIEWLVGDWSAKGEAGELNISYTWGENKTFIYGNYSVNKDGKSLFSGKHVIGSNPEGGLRSWVFDSSGTASESSWELDGKRWVVASAGLLPDGTPVSATNVMIPLSADEFTWLSIERTLGGAVRPDLPPVKVTRTKK